MASKMSAQRFLNSSSKQGRFFAETNVCNRTSQHWRWQSSLQPSVSTRALSQCQSEYASIERRYSTQRLSSPLYSRQTIAFRPAHHALGIPTRRWLSSKETTSDPTASVNMKEEYSQQSSDGEASNSSDTATQKQEYDEILLYRAPMGDLIRRLKRVSITSCLVSVFGLPLLIFLKNGMWPDVKQFSMGGVAFMSATGSTLALHFVFGPYIMELYELEPSTAGDNETSNPANSNTVVNDEETLMMKATIRTIFGFQKEILFNPSHDLSLYESGGVRPFANFVVTNTQFPQGFALYCHPELLSDRLRQTLIVQQPPISESQQNKGTTSEGLQQPRRPADEDDGFL